MAKTDVETLLVRLEASAAKFERDMTRARRVADTTTKDIENRFSKLNGGIARAIAPLGATLAGVLSVNEFRKATDTYIKAMNNLRVAGIATQQIPAVFDQLYQSAQRNAVPFEALTQLYGRLSMAQSTLKATSSELISLTDIVAQSLRVSGRSSQESAGALLQLGQALAGGKVQAEEYNSLLDGMYPLLQAAAAGIKEAGGDVAKLTTLVKDGKVSSEAFFRGIQAGSSVLEDKLAGAVLTNEQKMTRFNNELVKAIGTFNEMVGISSGVASGLDNIAGSMGGIAVAAANATNAAIAMIKTLQQGTLEIAKFMSAGAAATSQQNRTILETRLRDPGLSPMQRAGIQRQLDALSASGARAGGNAPEQSLARQSRQITGEAGALFNIPSEFPLGPSSLPVPPDAGTAQALRAAERNKGRIKAISLADFKVPGSEDKGGGSSKEKLNEYEREIAALQKKTELLKAETEAVGLGTAAVEKSKAVRELELAAKKAGVELTPAVKAAIEQEASAYAAAKQALEDKNAAMEKTKQLQEFIGSNVSSFFSDIVSGGKNASEALMNLTKRLADAALQAIILGQGPLSGLFGTTGPKGGVGGLVGALFGGLAGQRAMGGPVSAGKPYLVGEKRPEIFVPTTSGKIVPKVPSGGGGGVVINQSLTFNGEQDRGMLMAFGQRIKQETLAAVQAQRASRPDYLARGV